MPNPKFVISLDRKGEFRFVLRSINGEIILRSSEGYNSKQGCEYGIDSVKRNCRNDYSYERHDRAKFSFNIKATNGRVLGVSETYNSRQARENGIAAVKRDAKSAPIE